MRVFFSALLISVMLTLPVFAVNKENCGCGLGTLLMQEKEGLVWQVFAATTNGTFGNQTFGMSSGTLGCEKPANLAMRENLNIFVADNMDALAVDIAMGEGETILALAEIGGVEESSRANFFASLQSNFDLIYSDSNLENGLVADSIYKIIENI